MERRQIVLHRRLAPKLGLILVGMTGAFRITGMAPREKDKDVIGTCFISRWLGKKKMHG